MASPPPPDSRGKKTGDDDDENGDVDDGAKTIKLFGAMIPIGRDDGDQAPVMLSGDVNIHSSSSSTAAATHHHQEIAEVLDEKKEKGPTQIHQETIFPPGNLIDQGLHHLIKNKNTSSTGSADGEGSSSSATTGNNIIARTPIKLPSLRPMAGGFQELMGAEDTHPSLFMKKLKRGDISRLKVPNVDGFWDNLKFALTEEELTELMKKDGFIRVSATDARTNINYQFHLSAAPENSVAFVLDHEWHKFLKDNELTLRDMVEGWGYRGGEADLHLLLTFNKVQKSPLETEMEQQLKN